MGKSGRKTLKNRTQGLKPSPIAHYTARLKPCFRAVSFSQPVHSKKEHFNCCAMQPSG
jgi:hypothetical protein